MLRLLEQKRTEHPFFHEAMGVRLYSLEELVFLLESRMHVIETVRMIAQLFDWTEEELVMPNLAEKLRLCFAREQDAFVCAGLLLSESGVVPLSELKKLSALLTAMRGKTKLERRKMSGDVFLEDGRHRLAAYTYMELLSPEYAGQMTEELQSHLLHNLGVVYARLLLFEEAAKLFAKAYALKKEPASREAYLFAMNFLEDSYSLEEQSMDLNLAVMKEALDKFSARQAEVEAEIFGLQ